MRMSGKIIYIDDSSFGTKSGTFRVIRGNIKNIPYESIRKFPDRIKTVSHSHMIVLVP